jgi:hypothetical protein
MKRLSVFSIFIHFLLCGRAGVVCTFSGCEKMKLLKSSCASAGLSCGTCALASEPPPTTALSLICVSHHVACSNHPHKLQVFELLLVSLDANAVALLHDPGLTRSGVEARAQVRLHLGHPLVVALVIANPIVHLRKNKKKTTWKKQKPLQNMLLTPL